MWPVPTIRSWAVEEHGSRIASVATWRRGAGARCWGAPLTPPRACESCPGRVLCRQRAACVCIIIVICSSSRIITIIRIIIITIIIIMLSMMIYDYYCYDCES